MIPKVEFVYSDVYDGIWTKVKEKDKIPVKTIEKYIKDVEKIWEKIETKVLNEISKFSGLKWTERKIKCYVLRSGRCFSDPLTIPYFKDKRDFIDVLVHELIHQVQIQGADNFPLWLQYIKKKYPKESRLVIGHIFLHSVHKKIYLKLFDKKRLEHDLKISEKYHDYKRAWEIVEEKGVDDIIKRFKEITKLKNKKFLVNIPS